MAAQGQAAGQTPAQSKKAGRQGLGIGQAASNQQQTQKLAKSHKIKSHEISYKDPSRAGRSDIETLSVVRRGFKSGVSTTLLVVLHQTNPILSMDANTITRSLRFIDSEVVKRSIAHGLQHSSE
jgi:hypothetical protein